jgi:pimeloyl-ACP methyl ester carboxylesterase
MGRKRREQHSVQSADGTRIGYTVTGAGPSLLLVHGTAVDSRSCVLLGTVLAQSRQVAAMDRRGRGLSGDGGSYSLDSEAEDVLAVIGALEPPVHVVGVSYGGLPVLEAAARSDRLAAVTLFEPPIRTGDYTFLTEPGMAELDRLIDEGRRDDAARHVLREGMAASAEDLRQLAALPGAWAAVVAVIPVTGRGVPRHVPLRAAAGDAGGVKAPITVMVGGDSEPRFLAGAEALVARGPDHPQAHPARADPPAPLIARPCWPRRSSRPAPRGQVSGAEPSRARPTPP